MQLDTLFLPQGFANEQTALFRVSVRIADIGDHIDVQIGLSARWHDDATRNVLTENVRDVAVECGAVEYAETPEHACLSVVEVAARAISFFIDHGALEWRSGRWKWTGPVPDPADLPN